MRTSQRSLIVASLVVLATALASYCLDYQTHEACRRGDQLLENPPPYLFPRVPLVASPILIELGEAFNQSDSSGSVSCGTVSGLYPRGSITSNAAAIGGFLVPFLLLVGATYLALGRLRARTAGGVGVQAKVESPSSPFPPASARDPIAGSGNFVLISLVIFPVLLALDMPSVMLLSRLRLPRWFFALLVFRALANNVNH